MTDPTASTPSPATIAATAGREIKYLDTIDAYDQWAEVYDTDGNFLQALDTLEMRSLLPTFVSLLPTNANTNTNTNNTTGPTLIDLGCGTGRNTIPLLQSAPTNATIIGLDPSTKMLELARQRVSVYFDENPHVNRKLGSGEDRVSFQVYNMLDTSVSNAAAGNVDGIISTLVMEHVPMDTFFGAAAGLLKKGGVLLVTNMHEEMGKQGQAGFVDPKTGVKIRATSYAHTVKEMVGVAERAGFEVIGEVKEVMVDDELAGRLGPRARKWVRVKVWFGGCFRKL
ncbi:hypothetical protein AJ79_03321 [Helicocarpus griseus UAMH5409]|uniref:Methyltransferase domain-containing protein n=1 Tax=Helicocarpus griseus UAMH5409 TaxID=1447875 RepID=A0A2B7XXG5_9EURO|nr:hypothetical protein AJ79_03321 [Helicocarpus griseus UAMH5409]